MIAEDYLDVILVPLGLSALIAYHLHLIYVIRRHPLRTVVGANHVNRGAWVRSIMKNQTGFGVLAAQTLRNSIMGATLQATTSITLASSLAAFLASSASASLRDRVHPIVVGSKSEAVLVVKFFAALVCFLVSFLCYVQAIRYTNHAIFIINIPTEDYPELTPEYVAGVLARGSNFQTLGTRTYYFALPFLLWIFGPIPMTACAFVSVPVMWRADFSADFLRELESEAAGSGAGDKREEGGEGDLESQRMEDGYRGGRGGVGGGVGEGGDGEAKRRVAVNGSQDEGGD